MADSQVDRKSKRRSTYQDLNDYTKDEFDEITHKYRDDKDYDEAFKNLLRPIESITKKNQGEPLQYDLLKELDSYLNHLRVSSEGGSSIFVEAALMIQNVILIYQKRVDQLIDHMMKLIQKFRAYRINQNENDNADEDVEKVENNKKKKKENKVKYYSSFEPIKGQICTTFKIFDSKDINLSKKPALPKIVLNANIKVDNKYSKILPYICIGNGENIGKKYDFMVNYPLNRDLAVNEEFDCPTKKDKICTSPLKYRKSTDPLPMNTMDVDEEDLNDILPSTPDPVIFDQTVVETRTHYERNEVFTLDASINTAANDDDAWATVLNTVDNAFSDKSRIKKKVIKKENNAVWLPSYTVGELCCQLMKLKSGLPVDSSFRQLVHMALESQKSEITKNKNQRIKELDRKQFDHYDEDFEKRLKNGEECGFKGFDSPVHNGDLDDNFDDPENEEEIVDIGVDANEENYQSYRKNALDMQRHEQNQIEIMNEQLEMRKRVQAWHDNLHPILEEEEKRTTFDIHEYGTQVLNCFNSVGEQKSFKELVGGLEQEEVARYFLSILMMTNTYNLKIIKSNDNFDGEMKTELLKKERHHEELQVNIGNQVNQST